MDAVSCLSSCFPFNVFCQHCGGSLMLPMMKSGLCRGKPLGGRPQGFTMIQGISCYMPKSWLFFLCLCLTHVVVVRLYIFRWFAYHLIVDVCEQEAGSTVCAVCSVWDGWLFLFHTSFILQTSLWYVVLNHRTMGFGKMALFMGKTHVMELF